MEWLPTASTTVEPARSDMARCAGGGIIRSSVDTRYQLGFVRQAASVIDPPRASTPHGTCESAQAGGLLGRNVGGERRRELLAVQEEEAVLGRQDRWYRCAR